MSAVPGEMAGSLASWAGASQPIGGMVIVSWTLHSGATTMIRYATEPGSPVVEITVEGRLTDSDFRGAIDRLQADVEQNGKTRVLERIEHFSGMEPAAIWTDIKLGMPLAQKITRAAVVADAAWIRRLTDIGRLLTRAEVKTFRPDELDLARTWINAD
jgi:hypothetical protein